MLIEGQVIWIKFKFNNNPGDISATKHPYVVVNIDDDINAVEVVQIDSVDGKLYKAYLEENMFIHGANEAALGKNCFAQLDNCFKIENGNSLDIYKRTETTLSKDVFPELKRKYTLYQMQNYISENKTVYLTLEELEKINKT